MKIEIGIILILFCCLVIAFISYDIGRRIEKNKWEKILKTAHRASVIMQTLREGKPVTIDVDGMYIDGKLWGGSNE